jgi:hypothetical protein
MEVSFIIGEIQEDYYHSLKTILLRYSQTQSSPTAPSAMSSWPTTRRKRRKRMGSRRKRRRGRGRMTRKTYTQCCRCLVERIALAKRSVLLRSKASRRKTFPKK